MCVFWGVKDFQHGVPCDCSVTDTDTEQYSTDSRSAFSVCGHAPARILGPARTRLQRLDLIIQLSSNSLNFVFHSSASMPARSEEALDQERPYVQKGLYGPDGTGHRC